MQFEEHDWKNILKYKEAGVRWQLLPAEDKPVESVAPAVDVEITQQLSDLEKFEQAVGDGVIEKRRGGWFFLGDKNLGRIEAAVKNFSEL